MLNTKQKIRNDLIRDSINWSILNGHDVSDVKQMVDQITKLLDEVEKETLEKNTVALKILQSIIDDMKHFYISESSK